MESKQVQKTKLTTIPVTEETKEKIKKFINELNKKLKIKLHMTTVLDMLFDEKNFEKLERIVLDTIYDIVYKERKKLIDKAPFAQQLQKDIPLNSPEGQALLKWIEELRQSGP